MYGAPAIGLTVIPEAKIGGRRPACTVAVPLATAVTPPSWVIVTRIA
jgi:hypothetical protein